MPTATLNFSRNGFQIAVQYYMMLRLGFEGYKRLMQHTLDNAIALRETLVNSGYFDIMNTTQRIPVVAVTLNKKVTRFNEFDVSNKVREKGWVLSAYTCHPMPKQYAAFVSFCALISIKMLHSNSRARRKCNAAGASRAKC